MALTFAQDCPHCRTKAIGFTGRYDWKIPNEHDQKFLLATCNGCAGGVVFQLRLTKHNADYAFDKAVGDLKSNGIYVMRRWPGEVGDGVPADVPDNIADLYRQAVLCSRQQARDAAGMTLRKTLEVSTKTLEPSLAGKSLASRIDALHGAQKLTADIRDWAHEIRLDGNEAAHDEAPFSRDQVASLIQFVEAYIRYIYTLPALVSKSRLKREEA
jgi:hypothetical protein